jgi:signal transduction histidine kinase
MSAVFQSLPEALINVVMHMQARKVMSRAEVRSGWLYLSVQDDGCGFDVERGRQSATQRHSFGLPGMEERVALTGGRLRIHSVPMEGPRVQMWLPATSDKGR